MCYCCHLGIHKEKDPSCFGMEDHQYTWGHMTYRDGQGVGITHDGRGRSTYICIKCGKKESVCKSGGFHEPRGDND